MLNWVEILKRIMTLYHVRTQAELGMAMGIPVSIGIGPNTGNAVIPWPVLERVVHEKGVSWDWLLAGEGTDDGKTDKDPDAAPAPAREQDAVDNRQSRSGDTVPRVETRELARQLLPREDEPEGRPADSANPEPSAEERENLSGTALIQLREIKANMLKEIERVDRLLGE